jgi:hypothetical protein
MYDNQINAYLAKTTPLYIPKLKTPVKTLNDFLEKALGDFHNVPSGTTGITPWVSDMVTKNGKKRLKKIYERYEETCEEVGIVDFDQFRAFYYLLAVTVEQVEKLLFLTTSEQLTTTTLTNDALASQSQAEPMDLEISKNTEHQLEVVIPESSTKKTSISHTELSAKAQTFTPPATPQAKRVVTFAEMTSRNLGAGSKRDLSPMPVELREKSTSKKAQHTNTKNKLELIRKPIHNLLNKFF